MCATIPSYCDKIQKKRKDGLGWIENGHTFVVIPLTEQWCLFLHPLGSELGQWLSDDNTVEVALWLWEASFSQNCLLPPLLLGMFTLELSLLRTQLPTAGKFPAKWKSHVWIF